MMGQAGAAEIELLPRATVQGETIRLGDVAVVLGAGREETQHLAAIELAPAPTPGQTRRWELHEIQSLLWQRQVTVHEHRFSGAGFVVVTRQAAVSRPAGQVPDEAARRQFESAARDAVVQFLRTYVSPEVSWIVRIDSVEPAGDLLAKAHRAAVVRAQVVRAPRDPALAPAGAWVGRQHFTLACPSGEGSTTWQVVAVVEVPGQVVVAAQALPRGVILQPEHVRLESMPQAPPEAATALQQVLGQETSQPLVAGRPVVLSALRRPQLVGRGDPVDVLVQRGGFRVRFPARAREPGSLGDTILVEPIHDRNPLAAQVVGVQQVHVVLPDEGSTGTVPATAPRRQLP
jgi:flagella basal body P-ring formation protein FlgA